MSKSTLHIFNGDSTRVLFEQSSIPGDLAVWREMLCEGPVVVGLGSKHFWEVREKFFTQAYKIPGEAYQKAVLEEFIKIEAFEKYEEVVLWFEYDLFCQINLIALCSYFFKSNKKLNISLICTGDEKGDGQLKGLGEFPATDYPGFFKNRKKLQPRDLQFCHESWKLYCSANPLALQKHLTTHSNKKLSYLNAALKAHLHRFPSTKNGLNEIEQKIIDLIGNGKFTRRKIVGEMLRWQTWYGFGDLQYFRYLEVLSPLYVEKEGLLYLNENGKYVKSGSQFYRKEKDTTFLGGALKREFVFDPQQNILSKK